MNFIQFLSLFCQDVGTLTQKCRRPGCRNFLQKVFYSAGGESEIAGQSEGHATRVEIKNQKETGRQQERIRKHEGKTKQQLFLNSRHTKSGLAGTKYELLRIGLSAVGTVVYFVLCFCVSAVL